MNSAFHLGYWMMPEEAILPVAVLLAVVGIVLWAIGLRTLGRALLFIGIGIVVLPIMLEPVVNEIFSYIPGWAVVVILVALGFYFVRLVLTLFLGKEGAGTLMAMGIASGVRSLFRLPGVLVRWGHGLRALLRSPNPRLRALGLMIAIVLAAAAGLAGRQIKDVSEAWTATSQSQATSAELFADHSDDN